MGTIVQRLSKLKCHFKWHLNEHISVSNTLMLESKMKAEMQGNPDAKAKALLLLSFALTVKDREHMFDIDKALYYVNSALNERLTNGEKFVAEANKLNIQLMRRQQENVEEALEKIENRSLSAHDEACIALIEAFALTSLQMSGLDRAVVLCNKAISLDSSMGEAYFTKGLVIGRLRRLNMGVEKAPSSEEIQAYEDAMKHWPSSPLPTLFYGLNIFDRSKIKSQPGMISKIENILVEAEEKASKLRHGISYKLIAQLYRLINAYTPKNYVHKQENAIKIALECSPNDVNILHEAALCYWRSSVRDLKKALHYLQKASDPKISIHDNVKADIHLIQLQKEIAQKEGHPFDAVLQFAKILPKYASQNINKAEIHIAIATEYFYKQDTEQNQKELIEALKLNPRHERCKRLTIKSIDKMSKDQEEKFQNGTITVAAYKECFFESAKIFELFEPKNCERAKTFYEKILNIDETDAAAKEKLQKLWKDVERGGEDVHDTACDHGNDNDYDNCDDDGDDSDNTVSAANHHVVDNDDEQDNQDDNDTGNGDTDDDDDDYDDDDDQVLVNPEDDKVSFQDKQSAGCPQMCTEETKALSVTPCAQTFFEEHSNSEKVYRMKSDPRGLVIIINITEGREGAMVDEERIESLFISLKYKSETLRDKNKQEILRHLSDIATDSTCRLEKSDSLVVVCMAHGQKDEILDVDGEAIKYKEIVEVFQGRKCKSLEGKPKVFLIEACRGIRDDLVSHGDGGSHGDRVQSADEISREESPEESDRWVKNSTPTMEKTSTAPVPAQADVLMSYATVDGYKAYRNTKDGSRYIQALVEVFAKHAKDQHVADLLTLVNEELQKFASGRTYQMKSRSIQSTLQCAEQTSTLRKKLYFFPGF